MKIKCIVAATNSNGDPDLYFVIVKATRTQIDKGQHYSAAQAYAERAGYEPALCYDEECSAGKAMLPLFQWETATVLDIAKLRFDVTIKN